MKKPILILILVVVISIGVILLLKKPPIVNAPTQETEEVTAFADAQFGIHFSYPESWSTPSEASGIDFCPEEDTYRTPETLSITDKEITFPDVDLPNTDSFIDRGIKIHTLDPKNLNACGDELLLKLANGEVIPESLSSFKLNSIEINGIRGVYNPNASRLNTEGRIQYTLFKPEGETILVIQPYLSFIPYYGSPELKEMEETFNGDMELFLEKGASAEPIRKYIDELQDLVESLTTT